MSAYDLSDYLAPDAARSILLVGVNGTQAYEVCRSVRQPSGYARFLKNQHYETLWQDTLFVYRGLDTSNLPGDVYAQYTGTRYGAPWAKRLMSVGDVFERNPDIRTLSATGAFKGSAPGGVSYLTLANHYTVLSFVETQQQFGDVLELVWSFDAAAKQIVERYWYAKGLGLIGFDYLGSPAFHSRCAGFSSETPAFVPLPNFNEPVPPPVEKVDVPVPSITTAKPDNLGTAVPSKTVVPLKLHAAPKLASASITIPVGAAVTVYAAPLVAADGYTFAYVTFLSNSGWAAVDAGSNHAPSFDPAMLLPVPTPSPAPSPAPSPTPVPEPMITIPLSVYNRFYAAWVAVQVAGKELPPPSGGGF